ncbi:MAG: fibronectin/fibrinogen-binding protein [Christensenellaceae bacterium]|nr:fibronectin/fibrinogen-binding protein [Christensenellaceae bacterium]
MTLDGLTLHLIVEELKEPVIGCKVDRVHQPQPDTVVLTLRAPGKNPRLLISAGASDSRLHLTQQKYANPISPPMFCMFLRKHVIGAKITDVQQTGLERIVRISLEAKDELGLPRTLTLVAELMGKYSNVILLNEQGVIMDSLRHVSSAQSRVRSVFPGLNYEEPPSSKLNPLTISRATLAEMLGKRGKTKMKSYLSQFLQGISSQTADELLWRYMPEGYEEHPREAERLADVILGFFKELASPRPTMYFRDGVPFFFAPRHYRSVAAQSVQRFDTANAMGDAYYHRLREVEAFTRKRDNLIKLTQKHMDRLGQTLQKQLESLEQPKKAERHKMLGDIITANIYRISRGQRSLVAQDYETGEEVSIELDPRLSPAANAQQHYKRYNKLKASLDITISRMAETKKELAFLDIVLVSLDACETLNELAEVEYELARAGYAPQAKTVPQKSAQAPSQPHRFISSDGYVILAGKNNRQNDLLTMRTAEPDDIWLHTKDIPGAHVLITGAKGNAPETTLLEAASIAAYLSKAKNSGKVAVDYALRKNVRKPSGARPGMVIYDNYQTILVSPSREIFERLAAPTGNP